VGCKLNANKSGAKSRTKSGSKSRAKSGTKSGTKSRSKSGTKFGAKSRTKSGPKSGAKSRTKSGPKSGTKSEGILKIKNKKQTQVGLLGVRPVVYKIQQTVDIKVINKICAEIAIPINIKPLGFILWANIRMDLRDLNM
jgi:hypothetical protein